MRWARRRRRSRLDCSERLTKELLAAYEIHEGVQNTLHRWRAFLAFLTKAFVPCPSSLSLRTAFDINLSLVLVSPSRIQSFVLISDSNPGIRSSR